MNFPLGENRAEELPFATGISRSGLQQVTSDPYQTGLESPSRVFRHWPVDVSHMRLAWARSAWNGQRCERSGKVAVTHSHESVITAGDDHRAV